MVDHPGFTPAAWGPGAERQGGGNPVSGDILGRAVQRLALRKGVPHRKILEALTTEHIYIQLIRFAGALEHRNAKFSEQQLAVAENIVHRFDYEERMIVESEIFFSDCSADSTGHEEI